MRFAKLLIATLFMISVPFAVASDYRPPGGGDAGSGDGQPGGSDMTLQYRVNASTFGGISTITTDTNTPPNTTIDAGGGAITTTGAVTGGSVVADNLKLDGYTLS